jgi:hypothetical protein
MQCARFPPPPPTSGEEITCHSYTARRGARAFLLAALVCRINVHLRNIPWISLGSVGQFHDTTTLSRRKGRIGWTQRIVLSVTCCNIPVVQYEWNISVQIYRMHWDISRMTVVHFRSRDSAVGIATDYGLDEQGAGVRASVGSRCFLLHVVQIGSGIHPTSYPMGTRGILPRG